MVAVTTDVAVTVARLRAGGLAALPTETVYGLAADAENAAAVQRIYDVKGRPFDHPLIVHLAEGAELEDGWADLGDAGPAHDAARTLADTCWPGPLTMLVPRGRRVIDAVTGGRPTVGIRVPAHPDAHRILVEFAGGLAAPSANRFGRVSPTSAAHVIADLGSRLDPARDIVFDGGRSIVGLESTIVDLSVWPPQVLRAGAVGADDVTRLLDTPVAGAAGPSRASGMLLAHYAPACTVVPVDDDAAARRAVAELEAAGERVRLLDRTGDLVEAAFELYSDLRAADTDGLDALVVVLPPPSGLGLALRDRVLKAAAGGGRRSSRDG